MQSIVKCGWCAEVNRTAVKDNVIQLRRLMIDIVKSSVAVNSCLDCRHLTLSTEARIFDLSSSIVRQWLVHEISIFFFRDLTPFLNRGPSEQHLSPQKIAISIRADSGRSNHVNRLTHFVI